MGAGDLRRRWGVPAPFWPTSAREGAAKGEWCSQTSRAGTIDLLVSLDYDVRSRALALGRVADILAARGQLDDALRIYQEELPVLERLGDTRSLVVGRSNQAVALLYRGEKGDREEAARLLRLALEAATVMQIPEAATIRSIRLKYHL